MIGELQDLYRKDAFIGLNSKRGLSLIFFKYKLTAEKNLLHPHGFIFTKCSTIGDWVQPFQFSKGKS